MVKLLRISPTFQAEYDAGTYSGFYRPKNVIVLCDAGTLSAGFSVVVEFWRLTYERFKAYNLDPNAEYLYALTLR